MPTGKVSYPIRNFRFRLVIDGITQAGFTEVSGFDVTIDAIDYREGDKETHVQKLPGLTKFGNITLKWGTTDSTELFEWHRSVVDGRFKRRNFSIIAVDEAGNDSAQWDVFNAWPTRYHVPDFNAKGNDVAIETLEIAHEGVKRVK